MIYITMLSYSSRDDAEKILNTINASTLQALFQNNKIFKYFYQ